MTQKRRENLSLRIIALYKKRIAADYTLTRIDYGLARKARGDVDAIFSYLEIKNER